MSGPLTCRNSAGVSSTGKLLVSANHTFRATTAHFGEGVESAYFVILLRRFLEESCCLHRRWKSKNWPFLLVTNQNLVTLTMQLYTITTARICMDRYTKFEIRYSEQKGVSGYPCAVSGVSVKIKDVVSSTLAFTCCLVSLCNIFSEIRKLLQLMLVLPVATASTDLSFSCLRRLKTYLLTNMNAQRLNHLMILSIHRNCTVSLNVQNIASEFFS